MIQIGDETRRITELVESLRMQLERQTESTQLAHRTLDRLATGLASVPDTLRTQADAFASMQRRLDADASRLKQIDDDLSRLSGLGDTLKETTGSLTRFAEHSQKSGETLSTGLERVRQSLGQLSDSTSEGLRALDSLRTDFRDRCDEWTASTAGLSRRLVWFASSALALGVIALVLGVVALLR